MNMSSTGMTATAGVGGGPTDGLLMANNGIDGGASSDTGSMSGQSGSGQTMSGQAVRQRVRDLQRENSEMKELILFLDDERNYARLVVKEFNQRQLKTWHQMRHKLNLLEQKQFELIRENYSLKQLCVLLDTNNGTNGNSTPTLMTGVNGMSGSSSGCGGGRTPSTTAFCQYISYLESELRSRGVDIVRPKHVSDALRVNAIRESIVDSGDEKSIIESLSETAIKTIMNR